MKQSFFILSLICFLFVEGCSYGRNHPTKPRSEWGRDHADCERIVRKANRESPSGYTMLEDGIPAGYGEPASEIRLIRECMKKKGWR